MGSMRDERLNRMWGSKKVTFMRPDNCVHESMIPDWMDLVVWGHEHESRIEAVESDVGTFRVVQPGSSVATRLVEWESVAKKVTVLEIAGSEFRVRPVRLAIVRGFKTGTVKLNDPDHGLDVEDPKIDDKRDYEGGALDRVLHYEESESEEDSSEEEDDEEFKRIQKRKVTQQIKLTKPKEVLVRLRIEQPALRVQVRRGGRVWIRLLGGLPPGEARAGKRSSKASFIMDFIMQISVVKLPPLSF
ncbi:hypothetical protein ScalyP_jg6777 [Parmales sp. scaly parma]|nr:hypothetical protein ScalyP_jg6777 [Parmales sp. scaly parma]